MSTVHRENKNEINKSQQSSVYMDNTGKLLSGSLHTCRLRLTAHTHTRALTQTNKQADR